MVTLAATASAADEQEFTTNSLPIPEHGALEIKAPKGWRFERKGAINPNGPRTAALSSTNGEISVQITVFRDGLGTKEPKPSEEKLMEIVRTAAESRFLAGSVEKKVVIEKLKGAEVSGCFARFTDADWVGKKVPPGEFSHVATGAVRCGDLWGAFTLLTNDKDGPQFKQAMAVIESLRKATP
ncbi:MAG: hypothetical protein DME24_08225 [Verrucomicrobia bacterium]|nr:MAG: hypothetical protein DME24_08225 [Verrucomicrobiota bacterium]